VNATTPRQVTAWLDVHARANIDPIDPVPPGAVVTLDLVNLTRDDHWLRVRLLRVLRRAAVVYVNSGSPSVRRNVVELLRAAGVAEVGSGTSLPHPSADGR
jgi:hypothetical protein